MATALNKKLGKGESQQDQVKASYPAPPCNQQLWQFLLELLNNQNKYGGIISWTGRDAEFKLKDHEGVAREWGRRRNRPQMNYEKLSRAIRYYYSKNIIKKVPGKRFVYKFVHPQEKELQDARKGVQRNIGRITVIPQIRSSVSSYDESPASSNRTTPSPQDKYSNFATTLAAFATLSFHHPYYNPVQPAILQQY